MATGAIFQQAQNSQSDHTEIAKYLNSLAVDPVTLFNQLYTSPYNVISTTQQLGTELAGSSLQATFNKLQRMEGNAAFFKGMGISIVIALMERSNFLSNFLTARLQKFHLNHPLVHLLVPALVSHCVTYPFKLIRTRLIQQANHSQYRGIFDTFVQVRQHEGVMAFFSGFGLETLALLIGLVFDRLASKHITSYVSKYLHPLLLPLPAELICSFITYPILTLAVKLRGQLPTAPKSMRTDVNGKNAWEILTATLKKRGITGLWAGYGASLIATLAAASTHFILITTLSKVGFTRKLILNR